jgi:hypothetical protein
MPRIYKIQHLLPSLIFSSKERKSFLYGNSSSISMHANKTSAGQIINGVKRKQEKPEAQLARYT